mmetsp:Transcript_12717/g.27432  ORF Transcript_12717/g.27432 Transcript_12717/m.27432 type:complete len:217 (-) Transcript_12717:507-1157(-)
MLRPSHNQLCNPIHHRPLRPHRHHHRGRIRRIPPRHRGTRSPRRAHTAMLRTALVPRRARRRRMGNGTRGLRHPAGHGGLPLQKGSEAHGGPERRRRRRRELRSAASRRELHGTRDRSEPDRHRTLGDQGGEGVGGPRGGRVRGDASVGCSRRSSVVERGGRSRFVLGSEHGRESQSRQARRFVQRDPSRILVGWSSEPGPRGGDFYVEGFVDVLD